MVVVTDDTSCPTTHVLSDTTKKVGVKWDHWVPELQSGLTLLVRTNVCPSSKNKGRLVKDNKNY